MNKKEKFICLDKIETILPIRLKTFREQSGLSLREVAEKINKSPSQLSLWERGNNPPSCIDLFKLCYIYDISLVDLFPEIQKEITPTPKELELINNYRSADADVKTTIKKILEYTKE